MARFAYKAVMPSGDVVEGEMEANDQAMVVARLRAQGYTPIRADEVAAGGARRAAAGAWLARRRVAGRDLAVLTRELATLLGAGLPLERCLEILEDLADGPALRRLIGRVLERVRGGAALADAVAAEGDAFPPSYTSTLRAGEAGGALAPALARLADFLERAEALRQSVRSALIYPMILLVMTGLSIVVLLTVVVPQFTPLFEDAGAALPFSTRVLVALGDGLARYGWLIALAVAVLAVAARRLARNPEVRERWHGWLLAAPLLGGLIARIEAARFCRTLGTLVANGVPLLAAVAIARQGIGNAALAASVAGVEPALEEGRRLAEPLAEAGAFPRLAAHLIRVGEESGDLAPMLLEAADIYDRETRVALERLMAMLVPVVTIALGVLVAAVIMSILSAILSVYDLPF